MLRFYRLREWDVLGFILTGCFAGPISAALAQERTPLPCPSGSASQGALSSFPLSSGSLRLGDWTLKVDASLRAGWENRPAVSGQPQEKRGETLFAAYLNARKNLLGESGSPPCLTSDPALYQACHAAHAPQDATFLHQAWFGGRTDADLSTLTRHALAPVMASAEDIPILRTFQRFMEANDFSEVKRLAARNPDRLSDEQFIGLISMCGASLDAQYDQDRAEKRNGREKGIVSEEQLLQAAQWNLSHRAWWGESGPSGPKKAGVCRDIAVAQAALFDARYGKGSSFILSMSTIRGGHSFVIARHPSRPEQTLHLNYGRIIRSQGLDGSRALHFPQRGFGDVTPVAYTLYDAAGAPLSKVPSELGKIIQESIGFSPDWLDPLARKTSSLVRVSGEARSETWVPERTLGANVVSGETAVGQTVAGGGLKARWAPSARASTEVSAQGVFVQRSPDAGDTQASKGLSGTEGVVAFSQKNTLLKREFSAQNLKLRVDSEVNGQVSAYRFIEEKDAKQDFTVAGKVEATLENDAQKAALDEALWRVRLGLILTPNYSDVRQLNGSIQPTELTLIPNALFAEGTLTKRLSLLSAAELEALVRTDSLGGRGRVRARYRGSRCQVGARWSGRLWSSADAEGAALFQDSSLQRLGLEGGCQLTRGLSWDASLETAIDASDSTHLMTGVGGSF